MFTSILAFVFSLFGVPAGEGPGRPILVAQAPAAPPRTVPAPARTPAPRGTSPGTTSATAPVPSASPSRASTSPEARKIVDAVQKFYQQTPHLTAKFRQTHLNRTFGLPQVSDGWVYLKKPGRMRWDYLSKRIKEQVTKSQMSDGKTIWVVLVQNKQYFQQSLNQSALPVAVTFLTGTGNLNASFNAVLDTTGTWGTKTDRVLHLTPKEPSAQFNDLYLVVDPQNHRVKQSIVINSGGDVNKFEFFQPDTTKVVADSWFVFNPRTPAAKGFRRIKPPEPGGQPARPAPAVPAPAIRK